MSIRWGATRRIRACRPRAARRTRWAETKPRFSCEKVARLIGSSSLSQLRQQGAPATSATPDKPIWHKLGRTCPRRSPGHRRERALGCRCASDSASRQAATRRPLSHERSYHERSARGCASASLAASERPVGFAPAGQGPLPGDKQRSTKTTSSSLASRVASRTSPAVPRARQPNDTWTERWDSCSQRNGCSGRRAGSARSHTHRTPQVCCLVADEEENGPTWTRTRDQRIMSPRL